MAQTFRRVLTPGATLGAGEYTLTERGRPRIACPMCGHEFDLPPGFACDQMGLTNYCVSCDAPRCGWFDWAILADRWLEVP